MKTIILTAVTLAVATPALASDHFGRNSVFDRLPSAGVVILRNDTRFVSTVQRMFRGDSRFETLNVHNQNAQRQFRRHLRETNEGGLAK